MARKDFARIEAPRPATRGAKNMRSPWVVAGILILVGVSFVGGLLLGEKQGMDKAKYAGKQYLLQRLQTQGHELDMLKKKVEGRNHPVVRTKPQDTDLTFYNTLANQKVVPMPLDTSQNRPDHKRVVADIIRHELAHRGGKPAPGGSFRLQVGSYQHREDADNLKIRLKQKGFHAVVEQTTVLDLGLRFRVYTGPYTNRDVAGQAMLQVRTRMHITGLLRHD